MNLDIILLWKPRRVESIGGQSDVVGRHTERELGICVFFSVTLNDHGTCVSPFGLMEQLLCVVGPEDSTDFTKYLATCGPKFVVLWAV